MVKVTVKWGKESYDVDLDAAGSVADFRVQLYSLTGVPNDRQKLMCKAWKGVLKDDAAFSGMGLVDGTIITLMGSSEGIPKAVEKVTFVEDLPAHHAVRAGVALPSGLSNAGNTCYANSTLEALRYVPELKEALGDLKSRAQSEILARALAGGGAAGGAAAASAIMSAGAALSPFTKLDISLGELFSKLDSSPEPVAPVAFLNALRVCYPQFGEATASGFFKQQDSEEFASSLMTALAHELKYPTKTVPTLRPAGPTSDAGPNVFDTLFGLEMESELKCSEEASEPLVHKRDFARKLVCNIEGGAGAKTQINHLHEGILYGLAGDLEKHSDVLGRNAIWAKTSRIASLPRYICVQMMRFFWKATPESQDHAGVKCKMLRPVAFPADTFDVYDMCSEALRAKLRVNREKALIAEGALIKKGTTTGTDAAAAAAAGGGAAAAAPAAAASASTGSEEDELAAALKMSTVDDAASAGATTATATSAATGGAAVGGAGTASATSAAASTAEIGAHLPADFKGHYELYALVTHKGRSADSGHYISWVRKREADASAPYNAWLRFDDDSVSEVDTEYITSHLKGGGDDHMAYLLFYKAKA